MSSNDGHLDRATSPAWLGLCAQHAKPDPLRTDLIVSGSTRCVRSDHRTGIVSPCDYVCSFMFAARSGVPSEMGCAVWRDSDFVPRISAIDPIRRNSAVPSLGCSTL